MSTGLTGLKRKDASHISSYKDTMKSAFKLIEGVETASRFRDKDLMESYIEAIINPLTQIISEAAKGNSRYAFSAKPAGDAGETDRMLMRTDIMENDNTFAKERIEEYFRPLIESSAYLDMPVVRMAVAPQLYLNGIACTGRNLVPFQNAQTKEIRRERKVKYIVVNGESYEAPKCWENKELMDKILNQSIGNYVTEISLDDPALYVNGRYKFDVVGNITASAGATPVYTFTQKTDFPLSDKQLYGRLELSHIKVSIDGGADTILAVTKDLSGFKGVATPVNNNKIVATANIDGTNKVVLQGEVDFVDKSMLITASAPSNVVVKKVYATISLRNFDFSNPITSKTKIDTVLRTIEGRIDQELVYDDENVIELSRISNIDEMAEAYASMNELLMHAKDHKIISAIANQVNALAALKEAGKLETDEACFLQDYAEQTMDLIPGSDTGFQPSSRQEFKMEMIGEGLGLLNDSMASAFQSAKGVYTTFIFPERLNVRLTATTPVLTKGENYGGMAVDEPVFTIKTGNSYVKGVLSDRAEKLDESSYGSASIVGIPFSRDENQETRSFQQYSTMLDKTNNYRSKSNPYLPSMRMSEQFDTIDWHNVGCKLKLTNIFK